MHLVTYRQVRTTRAIPRLCQAGAPGGDELEVPVRNTDAGKGIREEQENADSQHGRHRER